MASKSKTLTPKKPQAIPVPVEESSLPTAIQLEESPPTEVEVVHIPAEGPLKMIFLPLLKVGKENAPNAHTAEAERWLGHVPNIKNYEGRFRWKSRSLVEVIVDGNAAKHGWGGTYFVYKCVKPDVGLPVNDKFEPIEDVRPYGDVFVFRLKNSGGVKSERVEYGNMKRDFLRNYDHNGVAKAILCGLAAFEPKEEPKKKPRGQKEEQQEGKQGEKPEEEPEKEREKKREEKGEGKGEERRGKRREEKGERKGGKNREGRGEEKGAKKGETKTRTKPEKKPEKLTGRRAG